MEWEELKNKSVKDLKDSLAELRLELHGLNFKARSNQLKQVHKIPLIRKTIARINTILNQKKATEVKK